jgi:ketosteroid isomerase-like protein
MNRLTISLMVAALCAGGAFGQNAQTAHRANTTGTNSATAGELKRIENEWANAMKSKDASKMNDILSDNWVAQTWDGKTIDKSQAMADMKKPNNNVENVEMGNMDVHVFGNTAVVTGSNTEQSTMNGKNTSGKYYWTDVFMKENGKWKAVASQSARAMEPGGTQSERSRSQQEQQK